VLVKWFPDRRGLITGIAVGGFGAGALVFAPVATRLIQSVGVLQTFAYLGIAYLVITMATGYFMQNPPDGWKPAGWVPSATQTKQRAAMDYTLGGALKTWQWWALWALLFLNTSAGISIISQESPDVSGDCQGQRRRGRGNGWHRQHRQRRGPNLLGLDLRCNHQAMDLCDDVPASGRPLLDTARHLFGGDSYGPVVHRPDVLRRRVRHHAGFCRRLLRIEECWAHLRTYAHSVGLRERIWPAAHRAYAAKQRIVYKRSHVIAGIMAVSMLLPILVSPPKEDILQAFCEGIQHKPETSFGNVKADVLADKDQDFHRAYFCSVIRDSSWRS
jgi:hypothetical protein